MGETQLPSSENYGVDLGRSNNDHEIITVIHGHLTCAEHRGYYCVSSARAVMQSSVAATRQRAAAAMRSMLGNISQRAGMSAPAAAIRRQPVPPKLSTPLPDPANSLRGSAQRRHQVCQGLSSVHVHLYTEYCLCKSRFTFIVGYVGDVILRPVSCSEKIGWTGGQVPKDITGRGGRCQICARSSI